MLLAATLVLAWARYDLSRTVDGQPQYTIINDEYSQVITVPPYTGTEPGTAPMAEVNGVEQVITLHAGQTLYGVRLDVATFDQVLYAGYLRVDLLPMESDEPLARAAVVAGNLKDNTFTDFIFDTPYTAQADGTMRLRVWQDSFGGVEKPVGLWASEGQVDALALSDAATGNALDATLAIQYISNYSGTWSGRVSLALDILLFAAVAAAFVILFFRPRGAGPAAAFAAAALLLGGAFSFVTPALVAPDEYTHLAKSYRLASELTGQAAVAEDDTLLVRPCDSAYIKTETGDIGIFAYKQMAENLLETGCAPETTAHTKIAAEELSGVAHLQYLPQTLGIALARGLGLGFHGMLLCGRILNLLAYAALCLLALHLAPVRLRPLFACVGLLPMGLQLAASLSPDAMVLGLIFAFTALCVSLRERAATRRQLAGLLALTFLVGPSKAIYLPVVLLCFIIPSAHLDWRAAPDERKVAWKKFSFLPGTAVKLAALALAALNWALNNSGTLAYAARDVDTVGMQRMGMLALTAAAVLGTGYVAVRRRPKARRAYFGVLVVLALAAVVLGFYRLTHMYGGVTEGELLAGIQPNGDSIYTYSFGYICRHLGDTVKLLLRSVQSQSPLWLQGLLGTALGEPIVYGVYANWLLTIGLLLAVLASATRTVDEPPRLGTRSRWGVCGIVLCVAALMVAAALTWTPVNYTTIFGVQGRYLLPVLPLALLLFGENDVVRLKRPPARGAVFATVCLTSLVLLEGFGTYAAWQQ